jgi:hypothetical protein
MISLKSIGRARQARIQHCCYIPRRTVAPVELDGLKTVDATADNGQTTIQKEGIAMKSEKRVSFGVGQAACIIAGILLVTATGYATEQSHQRQDARDTRQDAKQGARQEKVDCRQANQKSNAACRHDKRDTKQEGRQDARDIKY